MEETTLQIAKDGALDEENSQALINLLPESIKESLLKSQNYFLQDLSIESHRKQIAHMTEYPLVQKLRQSFWLEYERALTAKTKMMMTRVWQGISSSSGDFYNIMKKEHFAAYIFTKPLARDVNDREMLEQATERLKEILSVSPKFTKNDREVIDTQLAKIQLEAFKFLDERVQGGIIKKVQVTAEQKNLNLNHNLNENKTTVELISDDQKKIDDLKKELFQLTQSHPDILTSGHVVPEEEDDSAY